MILRMYQCTDVIATHHFLQVAHGVHVEHNDRELVFLAHAGSGQVHHLEAKTISPERVIKVANVSHFAVT